MVNHSTPHRGQPIGMLRALGKQPPRTDLMTGHPSGNRDKLFVSL